jgi:two-component system, NtrC family, sensor kinase
MSHLTTLEDLVGIEHCKLGFYQDLQQKVEQLKSSNLELEKKRKEIQALLDGITDLMVVLDEDLTIQRVNHVFTEWFPGIDPIGKNCHQIFRNRVDRCEECPALRALDQDQIVKDLCIYKVGNDYKHYEIIASPLKASPTGEPQVLLFKRDVTLEKEFQAQFYQAEKMATVGTLAAGVAHEINNPLTAILGFAQGLKRRNSRTQRRHRRGVVRRFHRVHRDHHQGMPALPGYCPNAPDLQPAHRREPRPGRSQPVRDRHPVHPQASFQGTSGPLGPDRTAGEPAAILGDESQLKQVIINLLTNAFDATDAGGRILIRTRLENNNRVTLVIEDNGCGIPMEVQDKLFEPFFTTKPVGKGIGIGLSTCYSIVSNHGGEISVTSMVGKGSSFKVALPGMEG